MLNINDDFLIIILFQMTDLIIFRNFIFIFSDIFREGYVFKFGKCEVEVGILGSC